MLREQFIGRNPTHFVSSSIVRAFITSELFLWSAWDTVIPFLSIFLVRNIPGAGIETAAFGYSTYLVVRVVFELISGKDLAQSSDKKKIYAAVLGLLFTSVACFGFALIKSMPLIFICYVLAGIGIGIASPAKNSLFSTHLDKNKAPAEWSIYDAVVFICIALATSLGGFIASNYGFEAFFIAAAFWILIGTIPYLLYVNGKRAN